MNTPKIVVLALIIALVAAFAAIGQETRSFEVRAEVATRCDVIAADDIILPLYVGEQVEATDDWNVKCTTRDTTIEVEYNDGLWPSGPGQRAMAEITTTGTGAGRLQYDLSSSGGGLTDANGQVNGSTTIVVPAGQIQPAGGYADTVTITVRF